MKAVAFSEVGVGSLFKTSVDGTWHVKTSRGTGMYQSWGTRYEPPFKSTELVYIEAT